MRVGYATGGNYTIDVDDGVVDVRVWRRPDVTMPVGAAFAQEKVSHLTVLAARPDVTGLVLNLTDAPAVIGPVTQKAVQDMLSGFVERRRPIAIVVGDSSMQRMQCERLLRELGQPDGAVFDTVDDAWRAVRSLTAGPAGNAT
jgi:hypothetical protein